MVLDMVLVVFEQQSTTGGLRGLKVNTTRVSLS